MLSQAHTSAVEGRRVDFVSRVGGWAGGSRFWRGPASSPWTHLVWYHGLRSTHAMPSFYISRYGLLIDSFLLPPSPHGVMRDACRMRLRPILQAYMNLATRFFGRPAVIVGARIQLRSDQRMRSYPGPISSPMMLRGPAGSHRYPHQVKGYM
jgi:hypothetical protein